MNSEHTIHLQKALIGYNYLAVHSKIYLSLKNNIYNAEEECAEKRRLLILKPIFFFGKIK